MHATMSPPAERPCRIARCHRVFQCSAASLPDRPASAAPPACGDPPRSPPLGLAPAARARPCASPPVGSCQSRTGCTQTSGNVQPNASALSRAPAAVDNHKMPAAQSDCIRNEARQLALFAHRISSSMPARGGVRRGAGAPSFPNSPVMVSAMCRPYPAPWHRCEAYLPEGGIGYHNLALVQLRARFAHGGNSIVMLSRSHGRSSFPPRRTRTWRRGLQLLEHVLHGVGGRVG